MVQENVHLIGLWDSMWALYDKERPGNFNDILSALACTVDEYKLSE